MKKAVFNTTDSDYRDRYNNTECIVLHELNQNEYDRDDVGPMYRIELFDGNHIDAFEDELTVIEED